ncbi:MAG TPA: hypothetical protein VGJ00_09540 [Rhabdochlamydiaceae bacterium]|jgi:hypothetical protein
MKIDRKGLFFFFSGLAGLFFLINQNGESSQASYFVPLKIEGFTSAAIPYFEMTVENKSIRAKLDLGYQGSLTLPTEFIQKLSRKRLHGSEFSYGMKGKTYEKDVYEIPGIKIGPMAFFRIFAEEASLEFERDVKFGKKDENIEEDSAVLGLCTLYRFNFLLDCLHQSLILCDSLQTLKKHGYPIESFTETPLLFDRRFFEFEAVSDMGTLRCLLDTGCTLNFLNKDEEDNSHMVLRGDIDQLHVFNPENEDLMSIDLDKECKLTTFQIGNKDFGSMYFDRIKSPLDIDALIGMEFFKKTAVFFDMQNRKVYFWKPSDDD